LASTQIPKVYFDYNLLNMQSEGLPSVEFEKKLIYANQTNSTPKSVLYAAVIATNLQQGIELEKRLTNLPSVSGVESITHFWTEDQTPKREIVKEIKQELAVFRFPEPDARPGNLPLLSRTLFALGG